MKLLKEKGEHEISEKGEHEIRITLIKVKARSIEVEVNLDAEKERKLKFQVSFFDAPLTDNTLLPDGHRFTITLKETNMKVNPHEATLNVIEFPAHYVTTVFFVNAVSLSPNHLIRHHESDTHQVWYEVISAFIYRIGIKPNETLHFLFLILIILCLI